MSKSLYPQQAGRADLPCWPYAFMIMSDRRLADPNAYQISCQRSGVPRFVVMITYSDFGGRVLLRLVGVIFGLQDFCSVSKVVSRLCMIPNHGVQRIRPCESRHLSLPLYPRWAATADLTCPVVHMLSCPMTLSVEISVLMSQFYNKGWYWGRGG